MKIRKITKKDWKRCGEIVNAAVDKIKLDQKTKKFLKKRYTLSGMNKLSKTSDMFVYEKNNKVVGSGKLGKKRHEIGMMYVDPRSQRKGVGKKMMDNLENLAKKKKWKRIYVNSLNSAIGFYKKLGYKKINCKEKDNCRMEKKLK